MTVTYTLGDAAVALTVAAEPAQSIDGGAADYTILPGGTTPGMLYAKQQSWGTLRLNGATKIQALYGKDFNVERGFECDVKVF